MNKAFISRLYRLLLHLYPKGFQSKYAEEMQDVFAQAVEEATQGGLPALRSICLRELWNFPGTLLQAYAWERSSRVTRKILGEGALNFKELLAALMAFILPVAFILIDSTFAVARPVSLSITLALISITFTIGMVKGFPRWSLPYLGQVLAIVGYLIAFNGLVDLLEPTVRNSFATIPVDVRLQPLLEFFWAGFTWLGLLILTLLILGGVTLLRRFHPFRKRIQQDWTLVPFILYAEAVLALIPLFIQYGYKTPYMVASLLLLLGGAWMYLRSPSAWQRLLALLSGLSLAFCVIGFSQWAAEPGVGMNPGFRWNLAVSPPGQETWELTSQWAWMMIALLISALIHRLRQRRNFNLTL